MYINYFVIIIYIGRNIRNIWLTDLALKIHSTVTLSIVQVSLNCTVHSVHTYTYSAYISIYIKCKICKMWKIWWILKDRYFYHGEIFTSCYWDVSVRGWYWNWKMLLKLDDANIQRVGHTRHHHGRQIQLKIDKIYIFKNEGVRIWNEKFCFYLTRDLHVSNDHLPSVGHHAGKYLKWLCSKFSFFESRNNFPLWQVHVSTIKPQN